MQFVSKRNAKNRFNTSAPTPSKHLTFVRGAHSWIHHFIVFVLNTFASCFSCLGNNFTECLAGTYSGVGSSECRACQKGTHCPTDGLSTYFLCANGTYADKEGLSDCKLCDSGFRCPSVGMEAPEVCPNGTISNTTGSLNCILCPAGFRWGFCTR